MTSVVIGPFLEIEKEKEGTKKVSRWFKTSKTEGSLHPRVGGRYRGGSGGITSGGTLVSSEGDTQVRLGEVK